MSPGLSQQVHQVLPTPEQLPIAKGGNPERRELGRSERPSAGRACPAGPAGHARLSLHSASKHHGGGNQD